jgi:hypothetical protein
MKLLLTLLTLCIACNQTPTTNRQSDREFDDFVGNVKKVYVEWIPISGGNYPAGSRCREMTKVYDQNGRLTQHSLYPGACGEDEIRNDYSYAEDGSRSGKTLKIPGKNSPPPPPPMTLPQSNSEPERGEPRMTFKYDPASGRRTENSLVRPSGRLIYKTTYTYDHKGRITETTGLDSQGNISDRRVYRYSGDAKVPSRFAYYDGKGNVHEQTSYSDYEFNSQGDWIRRKETKEESFNRRSVSSIVRQIEYHLNK